MKQTLLFALGMVVISMISKADYGAWYTQGNFESSVRIEFQIEKNLDFRGEYCPVIIKTAKEFKNPLIVNFIEIQNK